MPDSVLTPAPLRTHTRRPGAPRSSASASTSPPGDGTWAVATDVMANAELTPAVSAPPSAGGVRRDRPEAACFVVLDPLPVVPIGRIAGALPFERAADPDRLTCPDSEMVEAPGDARLFRTAPEHAVVDLRPER